jgi:hypoxanthine phosphoribosyltransferase
MKQTISYSWSKFDNDIIFLYQKILSQHWIPDYIVGVKRGGLVPAIKLSHLLSKPMIMMSYQLRDSIDNSIRLLEAQTLPKDKNVLIVDDICDSGETITDIIQKFIEEGFNSVKTCALYFNDKQSFNIDFFANIIDRNTNAQWIIFPWEQ